MAAKRNLGPDVTALIHHIQLNESGWFNRAIGRAIKFLCWLSDSPLSLNELVLRQSEVGLDQLTAVNVAPIVQALCQSGELFETSDGKYKLSEEEKAKVEQAVNQAQVTENVVRSKVLAAAEKEGVDIESNGGELWNEFHRLFIVPFIKEFGARAYELVTGTGVEIGDLGFFAGVERRFPEDQRPAVKGMISELLDKGSLECRTYVLRMLNSYFFESATRLPADTVERVFGDSKTGRQLRFILDTNFLFSLLGLHANPSNQAVDMLIDTIRNIPSQIKVGLYVLPPTIDEFRRALTNYESQASEIRVTRNIVDAGAKAHLSGVLETYFERCREANYNISPEDYFAPYHENINAILHEKGIEVLQIASSAYDQDQRVIDDVVDQQSFYQRKFINEPSKVKGYVQIWHDVTLWYAVSDRRPDLCDTLFDADWVGVTIDYSLIAFDQHKRHRKGIPCMVHPATLVQALQVVVPYSEKLEAALFSLMQLPFLFEAFDIEDEKATTKILSVLSRYENIDDINVETISEILGDRALKGKIQTVEDSSGEFELIKEALIEHVRDTDAQRAQAFEELERTKGSLGEQLKKNEQKIEELTSALSAEAVNRGKETEKAKSLEAKIEELESANRRLQGEMHTAMNGNKAIAYCIIACVAAALGCFLLYLISWDFVRQQFGLVPAMFAMGVPVPAAVRTLRGRLEKLEKVKSMVAVKVVCYLDRYVGWAYTFIVVTVLGGVVLDQFDPVIEASKDLKGS